MAKQLASELEERKSAMLDPERPMLGPALDKLMVRIIYQFVERLWHNPRE